MPEETIFDIIEKVTSRIEPFHSRTLAWFLDEDKQFCISFLKAFLPADLLAEFNGQPHVIPELVLGDSKRIDISIQLNNAVVGIEVKTVDSSTTKGQLENYWNQLQTKYKDHHIYLIYLTPFNKNNCHETIFEGIHAIKEFDDFQKIPAHMGIHINWLDVVALYPVQHDNGQEYSMFCQHKKYIEEKVCDNRILVRNENSRGLEDFFGPEKVNRFINYLKSSNITVQENSFFTIPLAKNIHSFDAIIELIKILLDDNSFSTKKISSISKELRQEYESGEFGNFFKSVFLLADDLDFVWLKGEKDIGLRIAHKNHTSGVSVCTFSKEELKILKKR